MTIFTAFLVGLEGLSLETGSVLAGVLTSSVVTFLLSASSGGGECEGDVCLNDLVVAA